MENGSRSDLQALGNHARRILLLFRSAWHRMNGRAATAGMRGAREDDDACIANCTDGASSGGAAALGAEWQSPWWPTRPDEATRKSPRRASGTDEATRQPPWSSSGADEAARQSAWRSAGADEAAWQSPWRSSGTDEAARQSPRSMSRTITSTRRDWMCR